MDDIRSELDSIAGDGDSSQKKQDGSSSPLRPNSKYCSMTLPSWRQKQKQAVVASSPRPPESRRLFDANITPVEPRREEPRQIVQQRTSAPSFPSRAPVVIQKPTSSGMEIDDNAQLERPSSPLRPNEKYCSIVPPSKPQVARVAPQPPRLPGPHWTPNDEYRFGRSGMPPNPIYRNPDVPYRYMDTPSYPDQHRHSHHSDSYRNHHQPVGYSSPHRSSPPFPDRSRRSPSYTEHDTPHPSREIHPPSHYSNHYLNTGDHPPYSYDRDQELAGMREMQEAKRRQHERERKLEAERRLREEIEEQQERQRIAMEHERRRIQEEERFKATQLELRRQEVERLHTRTLELRKQERAKALEQERRRIEAEKERQARASVAEEERRMHEVERVQRERQTRAKLTFYGQLPQQKREEGIVQMTMKELEALKAQYKAEGEQKALAEARRETEAVKRLEGCLVKIDTRRMEEPEPMDVEESDSVESCVPSTSSSQQIAPKPLIIKVEPVEQPQPRIEINVDEIPLPNEPYASDSDEGDEEESERIGEDEKNEEEEKDDEDLLIIEKPPAEVVELSSDDEDTVAAVSEPKEIKQEVADSSDVRNPDDDDLWIVGTKRAARPTKHVYDPSKVKLEKEEDSQVKAIAASESSPSIPFNPAKVKPEPADKRKTEESMADTVLESSKVDEESFEESIEEERIAFGPALPPSSQPLEEEEVEAGVSQSSGVSPQATEEPSRERITVDEPARPPSPPLPDYEEVEEKEGEAGPPQEVLQQLQQPIADEQRMECGEGLDLLSALAAARRLVRQIGETVHTAHQERQRRPRRQRGQPHQPLPGSFMYALRTENRKRKERWDADDDKEEWLQEGCECLWGAVKRLRIEEEEDEVDEEEREKQQEIFAILARKRE